MKKRKKRTKRTDQSKPLAGVVIPTAAEDGVALMESPSDEGFGMGDEEEPLVTAEIPVAVLSEERGELGVDDGDDVLGPESLASSLQPDAGLPGPDASRSAFRQVGKEVLSMELDPEAWAQALAECGGTHDDALRFYARIRTESLTKSHRDKHEKTKELECRRRVSFRDYREVEVAESPSVATSAVPRLIDSVFWHVLAGVSLAGSILAARILWPSFFIHFEDSTVILLILSMQLIPLVAWWAGSGRRGAVTYAGVAQLTACIALTASVVLSVRLFENGDRLVAERQERPFIQALPNTVQTGGGEEALAGGEDAPEKSAAEVLLARSGKSSRRIDN